MRGVLKTNHYHRLLNVQTMANVEKHIISACTIVCQFLDIHARIR